MENNKRFSQLHSFKIEKSKNDENLYVCQGSLQSVTMADKNKNPDVVFEHFFLNEKETASLLQTNIFDIYKSNNSFKKPSVPLIAALESFILFSLSKKSYYEKKKLELYCFDAFSGELLDFNIKVFDSEDNEIVFESSKNIIELPLFLSGKLLITSDSYESKEILLNFTKDTYLEVLLYGNEF